MIRFQSINAVLGKFFLFPLSNPRRRWRVGKNETSLCSFLQHIIPGVCLICNIQSWGARGSKQKFSETIFWLALIFILVGASNSWNEERVRWIEVDQLAAGRRRARAGGFNDGGKWNYTNIMQRRIIRERYGESEMMHPFPVAAMSSSILLSLSLVTYTTTTTHKTRVICMCVPLSDCQQGPYIHCLRGNGLLNASLQWWTFHTKYCIQVDIVQLLAPQ